MPSSSLKTVYPWQKSAWERLQRARKANQLAHAYLLEGIAGMGKQHFAQCFIASLFCTSPNQDGYACEHCHGCHLFAANSHPDWHPVMPEPPSKMIKIEQIRELVEYSYQTAQLNGYKVILLSPAEAMNTASANALLKTLEEPGSHTMLLLLTDNAAHLPITVRSRCQRLHFLLPEQTTALAWLKAEINADVDYTLLLKLAHSAPLQALTLYQNNEYADRLNWFNSWGNWMIKKTGLMESMQALQKADLSRFLFHLSTWVADIARIHSGATFQQVTNSDVSSRLTDLSQRFDHSATLSYLAQLQEIILFTNGPTNLNTTLLLEDVLLRSSFVLNTKSAQPN